MNPFLRRRRKPGTPSEAAVAARDAVEKIANDITMDRIMAWHGDCVRELMATHGLPQADAEATAMMLFDENCGLQPFLAWPSSSQVAKDFQP